MEIQRREVAVLAAELASEYLKNRFGEWVLIEEKAPLDLVSDADKMAEKIIFGIINGFFPEDGVLSEESGMISSNKTGYCWIVDPLNGTHNFLNGFKEWGTLLALTKEGEVVLGVCYFPLLQEFFFAEKGRGAYCNKNKLRVSEARNLRGEFFLSDGILRCKPREILRDIEKFCGAGCRLRVYGSNPFSFLRVAMGQAVVATNRLCKPWDIAAPALFVEEAGGKVTDENGNPWHLDSENLILNSENLIATNGILHEQALLLFK